LRANGPRRVDSRRAKRRHEGRESGRAQQRGGARDVRHDIHGRDVEYEFLHDATSGHRAENADRDSNTVEVFIARLRRKLGAAAIETVRGLGYRVQVDK